ncbi:hypothetical protein H2201_009161 [Coniosporium apollinis]|uniref:DUF7924 domain-containing protein n=2 Tax=Coniosporium TaxID=2810619 RepID=A0ABQ9NHU2_9PEZI|nr:hypothetical protein H2199_009149 [Cladosporium sp. JES 115]KAJ9653262.1 hypothetical protein H2201_009161 [Coniosporium apollinis]
MVNSPRTPSKTKGTPRRKRQLSLGPSEPTAKSQQADEVADELLGIGIRVCEPDAMVPADIKERIQWFLQNPRDHALSPTSKDVIIPILRRSLRVNESTLMERLRRWLTEASEDENFEAGVVSENNCNWTANCVPFLQGDGNETFRILLEFYTTTTPRPDVTYGFKNTFPIRRLFTISSAVKAALDICHGILLPFLTVEWKSAWHGGCLAAAWLQCARNGAAAVAAMVRLYRLAGVKPETSDTCHYSIAIDQITIIFNVHWCWEDNEGHVFWEMTDFASYSLRMDDNIPVVRGLLYNIFKWARETRLPKINELLRKIKPEEVTDDLVKSLYVWTPVTAEAASVAAPSNETDEGIAMTQTASPASNAASATPSKLAAPPPQAPSTPATKTPAANDSTRAGCSPTGMSPPAKKQKGDIQ